LVGAASAPATWQMHTPGGMSSGTNRARVTPVRTMVVPSARNRAIIHSISGPGEEKSTQSATIDCGLLSCAAHPERFVVSYLQPIKHLGGPFPSPFREGGNCD